MLRWTAVFLVMGCGGGGGGVIDAGPEPLAECDLSPSDAGLSMAEGGRLVVPLVSKGAVSSVTFDAGALELAANDGGTLTLKAPYGGSDQVTVSASVRCGELVVERAWPIEVRKMKWTQLKPWQSDVTGPQAREYGVMFIDAEKPDRLIAGLGFVYKPAQFTPAQDLWEFDLVGETWTKLAPISAMPQLTGGRLVQVPGKREALYLGGFAPGFSTPYRLQRLFYGEATPRFADEPVTGGTGKGDYQPGFIYDPKRERYLSFCGANSATGYHCDVRSFKDGRWEDVAVAAAPKPRARNGHYFAYDAETDRLMMFGGDEQGDTMGDTWALLLGESPPRWVPLGDQQSLRRRNGSFVLDPLNHRLLVWGGTPDGASSTPDVWALDLDREREVWVQVKVPGAPPVRASSMAVYDAKRRRVVAGFGNSTAGVYADLWALSL